MNKLHFILLLLIHCVAFSAFADPRNPQASRGNIKVLSSEYGESVDSKKYSVANAIDGNPLTACVFERKATNFQKFAGLMFIFTSATEIDGISLINGYAKSDSLYAFNNSIRTFDIILPSQKVYHFSCNETTAFQDFKFPKANVKWMILKVTNEKHGSKYDDLCISEVSPTLDTTKLVYKESHYIVSTNGAEYESDFIFDVKTNKQFNTQRLDFACGAKDPFVVNDSTFVYDDGCEDNSHVEIVHLNTMQHHTIKNTQLDGFHLIDALGENSFIVKNKRTEKVFRFNALSNKYKPTNYTVKKYNDFWRWSERLESDLSKSYRKLE